MTSPDTLAQTIRDAHRRIVEEAGRWPTRAWNEALIVEAVTDAAVALDSLLAQVPEAATLREALSEIAEKRVGDLPNAWSEIARAALAATAPAETASPLQFNPGPLEVVERRDNVTAVSSILGGSREDRLRVWLALGGTEDNFPAPAETAR